MALFETFFSKTEKLKRRRTNPIIETYFGNYDKRQRRRKIKGEIYKW